MRNTLCEQEYSTELAQLVAKRDEEASALTALWEAKAAELRDVEQRAVSNLSVQGEVLEGKLDESERQLELPESFRPSKRLLDLHKSVQSLLWMRKYVALRVRVRRALSVSVSISVPRFNSITTGRSRGATGFPLSH